MSESSRRSKESVRGEEHSLQVLGYFQLLEEIGEHAQSAGGRRRVLALRPRYVLEEIQARRGLYEDLMKLEESACGLPFLGAEELGTVLLRVQPSDAILDGGELRLCLSHLQVAWEAENFLQESQVPGASWRPQGRLRSGLRLLPRAKCQFENLATGKGSLYALESAAGPGDWRARCRCPR